MTRDVVCVVPVIDPVRAQRLYESMAPPLRARTMWIVNTTMKFDPYEALDIERPGRNLGVAASWNLGRRCAVVWDAWLLHCSEAMVFGAEGGLDLLDALRRHEDQPWLGFIDHGWHLYANSPQLLEDVGTFDENFWPAYYEETDYLYRMHLAGWPSPRENALVGGTWVDVDAMNPDGDAHCIVDELVQVQFAPLTAYYVAKWGGPPGEERFTHPFNDERHDHAWWQLEGDRADG